MLTDTQKQTIQTAYSRFLEQRGLTARQGQKLMIGAIARTVGGVQVDAEGSRVAVGGEAGDQGGRHLCAVEAGTGTGKTVAYALAAIPLAQALDKTLVIATATVALQEQIVLKDLPDLRRYSGLHFSYALAKGRGRYACVYKLDFQLAHGSGDALGTQALYPDEQDALLPEKSLALYQHFLEALGDGSWDGDRDSWPQAIDDEDWQRLVTDHSQCAGRRCAYVTQCPFFRARETLQGADVVVANHDLVLADLALGGGAILSAPEQTIYVFDEGHHLPDKALQHFAAHSRIQGSVRWIQNATKQIAAVAQMLSGAQPVQAAIAQWPDTGKNLVDVLQAVQPLLEQIFAERSEEREKQYRFPGGLVPEALRDMAQQLVRYWSDAGDVLRDLSSAIEEMLDGRASDTPREVVEQAYTAVGGLWQRCSYGESLWRWYANEDETGKAPTARWLTLHETGSGFDLEVCASPVLPVSMLQSHLWERCFSAVITSATLTALGKFDRLRSRAGLPADTECVVVPSPFHYAQSAQLIVPRQAVEGGLVELHTQSLITFMHESVDLQEATLVLFSSRRQMLEVYQEVSREFRQAILLQDDYSKQQLLQLHRERVDKKQPSVIFGLASFAEGVDLPGDYLRHVVIAKIPFAPPDDPVEQTLSEWIEANGGNAFMQISVADASLRLVQAAGRLLRTETDTGRITILDKRLITKRYGRALLDGMPPFARLLN